MSKAFYKHNENVTEVLMMYKFILYQKNCIFLPETGLACSSDSTFFTSSVDVIIMTLLGWLIWLLKVLRLVTVFFAFLDALKLRSKNLCHFKSTLLEHLS